MRSMATLYVRDVPERLYKRLRSRARGNGRSLNAEVLEILDSTIRDDIDYGAVIDRLETRAREINLPPDAPRPEEIIREDRDSR
jgi:plasmid stability protein